MLIKYIQRIFKNEPSEICSHSGEKRLSALFFAPLKITLAKENRKSEEEEKRRPEKKQWLHSSEEVYLAVKFSRIRLDRKVVGKSACDNRERYCWWFWVYCSSKKFERMAREAMDLCLRGLGERKATKVDLTATVSGTAYWSYPILPFGIVVCTFFSDNLSRNSRLKILFTLMQINPLFKLGLILDVSVFNSWKLTYPLQPRSQGSLLPVPTERERRVGERIWERGCYPLPVYSMVIRAPVTRTSFERMARVAMDLCLRVLGERKATKVDSTATVSGTAYWSYPILPFGIVACTLFSDNLSRNSCLKILFTLM